MADQITAINSGFFDAINKDRVYSAEDMNKPYRRVLSDGVFAANDGSDSDDFKVLSAGAGLQISVHSGMAIVAHKWFESPHALLFDVSPNNDINGRIDSVILQIDDRETGRVGSVILREGTPAQTPEPPDLSTDEGVTEYRVANIAVASSAAAIQDTDITDLRGSSECPWITGLIQQVDTASLWTQFQAAYAAQYEQYRQDFLDYEAEQSAAWSAALAGLAGEIPTVAENIIVYRSNYTAAGTTTSVPINIASYAPQTDILLVFINGLLAAEGVKYTVAAGGTTITLTNSIGEGNTVNFLCLHAILAADISSAVSDMQRLNTRLSSYTSDSSWMSLSSLEAGITTDSANPAKIRWIGYDIYLDGAVKGVTSVGQSLFYVNYGCEPTSPHTFTTAAILSGEVKATVVLQIGTDGYCRVIGISNSFSADASVPISTTFPTATS